MRWARVKSCTSPSTICLTEWRSTGIPISGCRIRSASRSRAGSVPTSSPGSRASPPPRAPPAMPAGRAIAGPESDGGGAGGRHRRDPVQRRARDQAGGDRRGGRSPGPDPRAGGVTMPGDTTQPTPGMPDAYRRWRSSRLGQITDTLEERLIVGLAGPPSGRRILDAGRGHAVLAIGPRQTGRHRHQRRCRPAHACRETSSGRLPDLRVRPLESVGGQAPGQRLARLPHTARATFRSAHAPEGLVTEARLTVTGMHGAIYNPPFGAMAALLAGRDVWIAKRTTAGAAFLVVQGRKSA
jgi:hypothetical protein